MLEDIKELISHWKGPFFIGDHMTIGDLTIAPYFARMMVLEHYRDFTVPNTKAFENWHKWKENVLTHPSVSGTI